MRLAYQLTRDNFISGWKPSNMWRIIIPRCPQMRPPSPLFKSGYLTLSVEVS